MIKHPINLASADFVENRLEHFRWLRENAPVYRGRMMFLTFYFVSRYEDCVKLLRDERFVRNRATATGGGSRSPIPLPKSVQLLANSMITEDGEEHRRLRNLVHMAFTPRRLAALTERMETLADELLDQVDPSRPIDLIPAYALPIPESIIAQMVGVSQSEVPEFTHYIKSLASNYSTWRMLWMMFWKMPKAVRFVRGLIERKRRQPADDILTGLIEARDGADALSDDELAAMVFLLIVAGHETTVHLIANAVDVLLAHPDAFQRLRSQPNLMEGAVEEILRFCGPIHATKPMYAIEDVKLGDETIPKGSPVIPLLGAANHDPTQFDEPERFDIERSPNHHLGFGHGIHYCLGAPLARMETRIALDKLMQRFPDLQLAVERDQLRRQPMPGWLRFQSLPIVLRPN